MIREKTHPLVKCKVINNSGYKSITVNKIIRNFCRLDNYAYLGDIDGTLFIANEPFNESSLMSVADNGVVCIPKKLEAVLDSEYIELSVDLKNMDLFLIPVVA